MSNQPNTSVGLPASRRKSAPQSARTPANDKFWRRGEPLVWVSGGALATILLSAFVLLSVVAVNGLEYFWPARLEELRLADGSVLLGRRMTSTGEARRSADFPFRTANKGFGDPAPPVRRIKYTDVASTEFPSDALAVERTENSDFFGMLVDLQLAEIDVPASANPIQRLQSALTAIASRRAKVLDPIVAEIASVTWQRQTVQYAQLKLLYAKTELSAADKPGAKDILDKRLASLTARIEQNKAELAELDAQSNRLVAQQSTVEGLLRKNVAVFRDINHGAGDPGGGKLRTIALLQIVRVNQPNAMGFVARIGQYFAKVWELLSTPPRESNTEGGVLPALFGTVTLVFLMAICSFPLGVLAGIYLSEYALDGPLVRLVRIGVNNLAGIPSIVYGIFGVGFFIDFVGAGIDQHFYPERLASGPVFGRGGVLWAALTLGLLTVPVVIVATEEAIRVIPRGVREGSFALGATKFQTLWRVLVPLASPGILTGFILAMARAAGEVAPLMLTGVINSAATLPLDGHIPYFHLERQFMHLGFQLYSVAFQSPDAESARPLVYVIALLLVLIVLMLSGLAILLRNHMRKTLQIRTI